MESDEANVKCQKPGYLGEEDMGALYTTILTTSP